LPAHGGPSATLNHLRQQAASQLWELTGIC
jgi:hypothetical protein